MCVCVCIHFWMRNLCKTEPGGEGEGERLKEVLLLSDSVVEGLLLILSLGLTLADGVFLLVLPEIFGDSDILGSLFRL